MRRKIIIGSLLTAAVAAGFVSLGFGVRETTYAPLWLRMPLKAPRQTGEVIFLTLRGPTTTQSIAGAGKGPDETQTGFEHDLATLFAHELGAAPKFLVYPSYPALMAALKDNRGHVAVAGLTPTPELRQQFSFSPSYKLLQHQLIYRVAEPKPKALKALAGKRVAVIAETPAHDLVRSLTGDVPSIVMDVLPAETTLDELLTHIESGKSDFSLVDSFAFQVAKRVHPDLASAFNVGRESKVAWAFSPQADFETQQTSAAFFDKIRSNGTLNRLIDRYYGHTNRIQAVDSEAILEKMQSVLPKLRPYFHEAQQLTGIDWRVLAAIGYQESHWEPLATSPTGVRGLMMLTEDTADRMGVKNRLDARESILGGSRYLALLRDTVPVRIQEPDRTWLALAAYNQGYGHLEDARILTKRLNLNADVWLDVKKAYLKLREPEHYENLKHGTARGDEAVQFVENIRNYSDILTKLEKPLELENGFDLMLSDTEMGRAETAKPETAKPEAAKPKQPGLKLPKPLPLPPPVNLLSPVLPPATTPAAAPAKLQ